MLATPSPLHTHPRRQPRQAIYGTSINFCILPSLISTTAAVGADSQVSAIRVFAGEVEQVDSREDCEEAAEEGDGVDGVGGVEAAEEDEGGDEGEGCEGYVVEGVDTGI